MIPTEFTKAYQQALRDADASLDLISDLLDNIDSESEPMTAAREAFVAAQLALSTLRRKLKDIPVEDLIDDELADREDDEDEDEETESA